MKSDARKFYDEAMCWHRHGKHKGRGLATLQLNKMRRNLRPPLEPVDLKRTGRL